MLKARELIESNRLPEKERGLYCLIGQAEDGAVHFCDILKDKKYYNPGNNKMEGAVKTYMDSIKSK